LNKNEKSLLEISGLTIAFASKQVIDDVDLKVCSGETVGLVGKSGSGKTMIALAILGLLPAGAVVRRGEILYQDRNLLKLSAKELRKLRGREIGLIFQEPRSALNPVMRIEEQLLEGMKFHLGYSKTEAVQEGLRFLSTVGIEDPERCMAAYAYQLSGGMRQRVLIAMALSCKPRLLICDEMTSSVDSITENQLLALLARIKDEENLSILLITHSLPPVRRLADRVAVLFQGKVVEEGSVERILGGASHPFTRTLMATNQGGGQE
jgi:ABC-type dipeptide/oligopeptide/nickel transport system ATPase component